MKRQAISGAVLAALAAGAIATPTFAQPYRGYAYEDACQRKTHDSGTTGAVLGGIAGALVGSSLAGRHDGRTGGAVIGALAGAALGNNIGRSKAKSSCDGYADRGYYGSSYNSGYARNSYYSSHRARAYAYDPAPTYAYDPAPAYAYDRGYRESAYRYDDRRW
ncbi:MAG TPA: glycine zipper 2TM domain-containing protein [Phenylobacterium sp.]|nr:glycine zipper 2TM domain-containing protein [Phenylobacterium sp.]